MKPSFYEQKWHGLRNQPDRKDLDRLARQIALSFLDRYFYNDCHEDDYIRLLCEIATGFEDDDLNRIGSSALFGIVIEALCDDFEELQTEAYNRVMSQVLSFCRETPPGKDLDRELRRFSLHSREDIFNRIENIRAASDTARDMKPPDKVVILSRVTIGADVAVTSVLVQRIRRRFPGAEIVIIGSPRIHEIFGTNPRIRIREVRYHRRGNMIERFRSWLAVLKIIRDEMTTSGSEDLVVVDPDSRLSQLGVLPCIAPEKYLFFNSRGRDSYPKNMSIAELANLWMDNVFGESDFCYPRVWLQPSLVAQASRLSRALRTAGCRKMIAVNFGVGGNSRKRLPGDFEENLVQRLLEDPETVIILDRGVGDEELARSGAVMKAMERSGVPVEYVKFESPGEIRIPRGVIGVESTIGEIAAIIAQCDEFIGYDSACQHIAAALGVPTCTVFAGSNNVRFVRRWSACGPAKSEIVHVDTLTHPPMFDTEDIIMRIIDSRTV